MKIKNINFKYINMVALKNIDVILQKWLPDGRNIGGEWVARNPTRVDHKAGSFKINLRSGIWADFKTGDRGGDLISLYAYLFGVSQGDAGRDLMRILNINEAHYD